MWGGGGGGGGGGGRAAEGERVLRLRVNKPLISCLFTGNAGGGAERRQTDAAGRPGDVHPPHRGPAGRAGGGGVERRERHREVREFTKGASPLPQPSRLYDQTQPFTTLPSAAAFKLLWSP